MSQSLQGQWPRSSFALNDRDRHREVSDGLGTIKGVGVFALALPLTFALIWLAGEAYYEFTGKPLFTRD